MKFYSLLQILIEKHSHAHQFDQKETIAFCKESLFKVINHHIPDTKGVLLTRNGVVLEFHTGVVHINHSFEGIEVQGFPDCTSKDKEALLEALIKYEVNLSDYGLDGRL